MPPDAKPKKPPRKNDPRIHHPRSNDTESTVQIPDNPRLIPRSQWVRHGGQNQQDTDLPQNLDGTGSNMANYVLTSVAPPPYNRQRATMDDDTSIYRNSDNNLPPHPSVLPSQTGATNNLHATSPEVLKSTKLPAPSHLSSVARGFGSIGLRDFRNCILYIKENPRILKIDPEGLRAEAGRLLKTGDDESAHCHLQRFLILTHCQQHGLSDVHRAAVYIKAIAENTEVSAEVQRKIAALSATMRADNDTMNYNQTGLPGQRNPQQIPIRSHSYTEYNNEGMSRSASTQHTQPSDMKMSQSLPSATFQTVQSQPLGSGRPSVVEYYPKMSNNNLAKIDERSIPSAYDSAYETAPNRRFAPGQGNPNRPPDSSTAPVQMRPPNDQYQPDLRERDTPQVMQSPPSLPDPSSYSGPVVSMISTSRNHDERGYHGSSQRSHHDPRNIGNATQADQSLQPLATTLPSPLRLSGNPTVVIQPSGDPSILGDPSQLEMQKYNTVDIDGSYQVQGKQEAYNFFGPGQVFKLWWCQPAGSDLAGRTNPNIRRIKVSGRPDIFGEEVWMLVVVRRSGYSLCCPISTYENQGVLKSGIPKKEIRAHAVIYSVEQGLYQHPDEKKLLGKVPIAIHTDPGVSFLLPMSRVHFGKFHTVEWNVPVKSIGRVTDNQKELVRTYFISELTGTTRQHRHPPPPPPPPPRTPSRNPQQGTSEGRGGKPPKQRGK